MPERGRAQGREGPERVQGEGRALRPRQAPREEAVLRAGPRGCPRVPARAQGTPEEAPAESGEASAEATTGEGPGDAQ